MNSLLLLRFTPVRTMLVAVATPMLVAVATTILVAVATTMLVTVQLPSPALAEDNENHDAGHETAAVHEEGGHTFTVSDFEASGVVLATAGPGEVDSGVELPGEVRPNADRIAHLSPRFPGIAREVRKQLGDHVSAGEVLAVIESENLSNFALTAAFEGTVIGKHIVPGEAVSREEAAYIIADLSNVWILVSIYQSALAQVHPGQPVVVRASGAALEARGTVSYITPIVAQATRTATARVVLPNPDGAWRPGLFVTATIDDSAAAALVIARDALQTVGGKTVVFVKSGENFAIREVTTGRRGRSNVEILAGLQPGERYAEVRSFLVKAELTKAEGGEEHEH